MFDAARYPGVASRHCEIVFERKAFVLTNRSREGTLVNDGVVHHSIVLQAGDWIRLGPQGPQVRLLGQDPALARSLSRDVGVTWLAARRSRTRSSTIGTRTGPRAAAPCG